MVVYQDGGEFYGADEQLIWRSYQPVPEGDVDAAERARGRFIEWCERHGTLTPSFHS
jgi:hypothetical protein